MEVLYIFSNFIVFGLFQCYADPSVQNPAAMDCGWKEGWRIHRPPLGGAEQPCWSGGTSSPPGMLYWINKLIKPLNLTWHATVLWTNVKSVEFAVARYLRFLWPPPPPPTPKIYIFTSINKQIMKQCSNSLNKWNKLKQWHPHKPNPQKLSFQFG